MARKFKTPITLDELGSASSQAIAANVDGDSQNRINIDAGGKITWGSGSATGDTTLYRSDADTLKTDDAFTATSLAVTGQFTFPTSDGSADQVITTNGSGTLTWSDVSANATVSDTAPSSPAAGQIWYESDTGRTFVYYDSFWIEVGASPPSSPFITDLDEDTKIQVEESADEDKIRFDTAGSERMIIDASGNVGIGTTTPSVALHVDSGSTDQFAAPQIYVAPSGHASSDRAAIQLDDIQLLTDIAGDGTEDFSIYSNNAAAHRFSIDGSGNVGINDFSPSYTLDVNGDINATGNIRIGGTAVGEWTAYTPTFTGLTVGNGTLSFSYTQINKLVHVVGSFNLGSTSSIATTPIMSLPVIRYTSGLEVLGTGFLGDTGTGTYMLFPLSVTNNTVILFDADHTVGTTVIEGGVGPTDPFFWTTGDRINVNLTYRAA